jgi:hypothetical protein
MNTDRPGTLVRALRAGDVLTVRTEAALARARLLTKPPAPVATVHVPITCGRVGLTYLATGRRDGNTLSVSSAAPMPKARNTAPAVAKGAGFFSSVEFPNGWLCPGCRRPHSGVTWACDCARLAGTLHTCGDSGRVGICACGRSEVLHFVEVSGWDLRGSVSTPRAALNASSAAPRSTPALSPRVPPLLLPGRKS